MNKKLKFFLPVIIIAIGLISAMVMIKSRPKIQAKPVTFPAPLVRAKVIELQDFQLTIKSQGTVSPRTESELFSQVSGQVTEVSVQFAPGGFFERGEVLVKVDPRDYELALSRWKAQVAQAKLRLTQEQEEASIAQSEWKRLGKKEQPNPLVLREPQLAEARASLEGAQANLKQAELNLQRTRIRAPYNGRVRTKKVDLGQYVSPGAALATIYAVDYAEVRLPVPDNEMGYLECCLDYRSKNPATLNIDVTLKANYAGGDYRWAGKIVRVEGEIDPLSHMITLVARVEDPYGRDQRSDRPPLAVGLFVEAEIEGKRARDVVVIPRSALRVNDNVLVIDEENKLHFRAVEVLSKDSDTVIISSGLEQGERICLSPLEAVVEGMKVRVMSEAESSNVSSADGYMDVRND
ncbi:MAG: efflux RND transporter periplasmic adaptor subunit [Candidatus Aminicenantes bacterium]|nr:MAG: efflux RND transporter periplasmic adaptor subunit [Candidatus Aminicenantes bacterium]